MKNFHKSSVNSVNCFLVRSYCGIDNSFAVCNSLVKLCNLICSKVCSVNFICVSKSPAANILGGYLSVELGIVFGVRVNVVNLLKKKSLCKVKNNVIVAYFVILVKENPGVIGKNSC